MTRGLRVRRVGDIARARTRTSRKPATLPGKVDVSAERSGARARLARLEALQALGLSSLASTRSTDAARPRPAQLHERRHRLRRALEDGFDGPVAAVAHPAGHLPVAGRPAHGVAEEHTLDVTVHDDVDPAAGS